MILLPLKDRAATRPKNLPGGHRKPHRALPPRLRSAAHPDRRGPRPPRRIRRTSRTDRRSSRPRRACLRGAGCRPPRSRARVHVAVSGRRRRRRVSRRCRPRRSPTRRRSCSGTRPVAGPRPSPARRDATRLFRTRARVPARTPTRSAISVSKASTCGPSGATQPQRSASSTNCSSTSVMSARERWTRGPGASVPTRPASTGNPLADTHPPDPGLTGAILGPKGSTRPRPSHQRLGTTDAVLSLAVVKMQVKPGRGRRPLAVPGLRVRRTDHPLGLSAVHPRTVHDVGLTRTESWPEVHDHPRDKLPIVRAGDRRTLSPGTARGGLPHPGLTCTFTTPRGTGAVERLRTWPHD